MLIKRRFNRSCRSLFLAGTIVASSGVSRAVAQDAGDPDAGRRVAETWCQNCHVIDRQSKSGSNTGAPPFPAVADMTSTTPMALRVFLQTPHHRMPDLHLTRAEIDDVISYIMSLREK